MKDFACQVLEIMHKLAMMTFTVILIMMNMATVHVHEKMKWMGKMFLQNNLTKVKSLL